MPLLKRGCHGNSYRHGGHGSMAGGVRGGSSRLARLLRLPGGEAAQEEQGCPRDRAGEACHSTCGGGRGRRFRHPRPDLDSRAQAGGELARRGRAGIWRFGKPAQHGGLQLGGQARPLHRRRRREDLPVHDRELRLRAVIGSGERRHSDKGEVGDGSQRIHIAAGIRRGLAVDLLGADILDGAENISHNGQRGALIGVGHAEVGQLGPTARGEQDVGGLDIPVNDAFEVDAVQSGGDALDDACHSGRGQWPTRLDQLGQGPARHIFHDKGRGIALIEPVQGDDIGVAEAGHDGGLAPEAVGGDRVSRPTLHLDDDRAAVDAVPALVDGPDGAATERRQRQANAGQVREGGPLTIPLTVRLAPAIRLVRIVALVVMHIFSYRPYLVIIGDYRVMHGLWPGHECRAGMIPVVDRNSKKQAQKKRMIFFWAGGHRALSFTARSARSHPRRTRSGAIRLRSRPGTPGSSGP